MPTNLSIKAVPDQLIEKLRKRAERNHRSLQGELLTILEDILNAASPLSPDEAIRELRQIEVKTRDQAREIVRRDRDRR